MTRNIFMRLIPVVVLLVGSIQSFGQSTVTGGVSGQVTDPQGAVVPNATVTATNIGTNAAASGTTDDNGTYKIINLQPGTYRVEVGAISGFGAGKAENIIVEVGRFSNVDFKVVVGSATATVEVTAEAPEINVNDNSNANNFNQTAINELPINGRRWSNFAVLSPSAVPDGTFGLISFRGISGLLNNNTIDGGDNNQAFFSEERGRTRINYVISQAAIREFQVNTSNYSAEYGRSAGGVTNAVTKSGTNEFHGEAFYYNRNNANGARNPRAFQTVLINGVATLVDAKPPDLRQQWGGAIGGPIVKDKAFFFFSYDQQKRDFPGLGVTSSATFFNPINVVAPTAPLTCTSAFNLLTIGNVLSCRGITQTQANGVMNTLRGFIGETPRKGDQLLLLPKFDWQINSSNLFSISSNRLRWDSPNGIQTQATNTRGRDNFGDDFVDVDSVNAKLQSTISPTFLNEFRFQYGRDNEYQNSSAPLDGAPKTAFNNTKTPNIFITGGFEFGVPTFLERAKFPDETRWQFADTMTWIRGSHTFKFGGDMNWVKDDIANLRFEAGAFSYGNTADFILDWLNWQTAIPGTTVCGNSTRLVGRCYTSNYQQGIGNAGAVLKTTDVNLFIQDDYRVTPRLTVNLGLRYEYIKLPDPQIPNTSTTVIPNVNRTLAEATSFMPSDKNNFGPRAGFAYDLSGDGRTSIRGGWGVYFGRVQNSTMYNAIVNTGNPGGQAQVSIAPASGPLFPLLLPASSLTFSQGAVQYFATNFEAPLIHQYDLVFEHELWKNTIFSASYVGSLGRNLPTFVDYNYQRVNSAQTTFTVVDGPFSGQVFVLPAYTRVVGTQAMTQIESSVGSQYDAGVFQLRRRFTNDLQFNVSYTLAKSTDTNQNSATFTLTQAPYDLFDRLKYDRGPSNFDVRHKFVVSAVWAPNPYKGSNSFYKYLANGWSLAPIFVVYSGKPYDATVTGTSLNGSNGDNRFPLNPRNAYRLPKLMNVDARVSKRFKFSESMALELLAEGFNLANSTHKFGVSTSLYTRTGNNLALTKDTAGRPTFGDVTNTDSTLYRERQIQFAARFQF